MTASTFLPRAFQVCFITGLGVAVLHLGFVLLSFYQGEGALYAGLCPIILSASSILLIASVLLQRNQKALIAIAFFVSLFAVALGDVSIAKALNSLMSGSASLLDVLLIGLGFGVPIIGAGSAILLLMNRPNGSREA
ncbi:hypothetical protein L5849_00030 [Erythrobacter sp. SN021]|uniref:hypothetical protein n=1 Tax=Erythrobacter sp. SN021 TaxID=2912574 RepID=UPI001F35F7DE|nr:hypothetical protein [Erythrobacter sp. SN021]MCF8881081.1 hypothetical protein [Erythrobacter sp. SN021]